MRKLRTAFALLFMGSLAGCTAGTPANKAVEAAQNTQVAQAEPHRFVMHGTPSNVALLMDSATGKVWKYDSNKFVPIAVEGLDRPKYFNPDTGQIQETPATEAQKHPTATVRRYNPKTSKIE